jgi:hypothetical protein
MRIRPLPAAAWGALAAASAFAVLRDDPAPSAARADSIAESVAPPPSTEPGSMGSMTSAERRDFHIRLGHEECEDAMRKVNVLDGRAPADPRAINRLSVCLRIGNVAWYKCMLRAQGSGDANACHRRFLDPEHPP